MKKKISRLRLILLISFAVALFSLITYRIFYYNPGSDILKVETYRVSGGWGYKILLDDRVYIDQPFIPGFPGKMPFPDRRSALQAAKMVKTKMIQGNIPHLSREEIQKLGIDSMEIPEHIKP